MSNAIIGGVLFKDAEVKTSAAGRDYTSLVVKRSEYDSQQKKSVAAFYNVTAFGERYLKLAQSLLKQNAAVVVAGELRPRAYLGKNGPAVSRDMVADNIEFICFAQDNRRNESADEDETL